MVPGIWCGFWALNVKASVLRCLHNMDTPTTSGTPHWECSGKLSTCKDCMNTPVPAFLIIYFYIIRKAGSDLWNMWMSIIQPPAWSTSHESRLFSALSCQLLKSSNMEILPPLCNTNSHKKTFFSILRQNFFCYTLYPFLLLLLRTFENNLALSSLQSPIGS